MGFNTVRTRIRGALAASAIPPLVPTNTLRPTLSGTFMVGEEISFGAGTWIGPATTFTYQLMIDGVDVPDADGPTYTFVEADAGKVPRLREIPATGSPALSVEYEAVASDTDDTPEFSSAPTVSGSAVENGIVTATQGVATGSPTPDRAGQWYRSPSTAIAGATNLSYGIVTADVGSRLFYRDTATNINGTDFADSALTAVVTSGSEPESFFYIAPTTQGTGDGSSEANASGSPDLGILAAAIAVSPAARHIRVLSNLLDGSPCEYDRTGLPFLSIFSSGGALGENPPGTDEGIDPVRFKVYVEGWDAENEVVAKPKILSNRTLFTWVPDVATTISTTISSAAATVASAVGLVVGMSVWAVGVTADTKITVIDGTDITLSAVATASGSGVAASFEKITSVVGWTHGAEIFLIEDGVDNLVFQQLNFERVDTCFKFANGAFSDGCEFHDIDGYNIRRFIDTGNGTVSGGGTIMEVTGVLVDGITVIGHSKHGIRIRGNCHNWILSGCNFNSGRQDQDNFAVCYVLDQTAHDIVFIDDIARNCFDSRSSFRNGDGFTNEIGNYNTSYIRPQSFGHADAGLDCKASNNEIIDSIVGDNRVNLKIWAATRIENPTGTKTRTRGGVGGSSHIQGAGSICDIEVEGGSFTDGIYMGYSSETGIYGRARFRGVAFAGGSGFFSVNSNGFTVGVTSYDEDCTGVPDNHAALTTPTFSASVGAGGASAIQHAMPANEQNDIAVVAIAGDTTTAPSVSTGWTAMGDAVVQSTFTGRLFWKRLDAGQTFENVVCSAGTGTHMRVAAVWIIPGCVTTGVPFEGYAVTQGTGTTMTSPTTGVLGPSRAVYRVFLKSSNIVRSATPAGYTQRVSTQTAYGATGGIYVDSKEGVAASTAAASVSTIGASHPWISFGFAMLPLDATESLSAPVYSQDVAISGSTSPGAILTRVPGIVSGNPGPVQSWIWQKLVAVGGGGGSSAPFFTDGGTIPFSTSSGGSPPGAYNAATNKTWCVWESTNGTDPLRRCKVRVFDHDTDTWSQIYTIGTGLSGDDHGVGQIVHDHQNYTHVFWGAHTGACKHSRTTVAGDPSAWSAQPSIGNAAPNGQCYPHPVRIGNVIYLFMRLTYEGSYEYPLVLWESTAVNNGSITWAAMKRLFSFGNASRVYQHKWRVSGTKCYLVYDYTNADVSIRAGGYMLYYDTADGSVHNITDTYSETAAQLPVRLTKALSDTHFSAVGVTPAVGTNAEFIFDAAGVGHLFYNDNTSSFWKHRTLTGTTLGAPTQLSNINSEPILYLDASDRIVAIWGAWHQTSIKKSVRETNGVWGTTTTIHTFTHAYGRGVVSNVDPSSPDGRFMFGELQLPATNESGQLKGWLYGDSGFAGSDVTPTWTTVQNSGATYNATVSGDDVRIIETATNTEGSDTSTSATKTIV